MKLIIGSKLYDTDNSTLLYVNKWSDGEKSELYKTNKTGAYFIVCFDNRKKPLRTNSMTQEEVIDWLQETCLCDVETILTIFPDLEQA